MITLKLEEQEWRKQEGVEGARIEDINQCIIPIIKKQPLLLNSTCRD